MWKDYKNFYIPKINLNQKGNLQRTDAFSYPRRMEPTILEKCTFHPRSFSLSKVSIGFGWSSRNQRFLIDQKSYTWFKPLTLEQAPSSHVMWKTETLSDRCFNTDITIQLTLYVGPNWSSSSSLPLTFLRSQQNIYIYIYISIYTSC